MKANGKVPYISGSGSAQDWHTVSVVMARDLLWWQRRAYIEARMVDSISSRLRMTAEEIKELRNDIEHNSDFD